MTTIEKLLETEPFTDPTFAKGYEDWLAETLEPDWDEMADAELAMTLAEMGIKAA